MAEVSFTSAESYKGSMEQLVGLVRVERSCEEALRVDVHTISGSFRVLLRCTDLWITGFESGAGETFYFSGHAPHGASASRVLPLDGSHGDLGTEGMIIKEGTFYALADLVKFEGRCHANVRKALGLTVIAISEGIRYDEIQEGIRRVLAREVPDIDKLGPMGADNSQWTEMIKNWQTNSKAPEWEGFVRIKHIG